jgi:hypothetical protein
VDLNQKQQLTAARENAAKIKACFRPWRSIFVLGLAAVLGAVSRSVRTAVTSPEFDGTFFHALGRGGTGLAADGAGALAGPAGQDQDHLCPPRTG